MYNSISGSENVGMYSFCNLSTNSYLSCRDKDLILSERACPWTIRRVDENRFYICARDSEFLLDIDNAYIAEGTRIKLQYQTGYDVQIWCILKNGNGTYSIVYSGDNRYCLGFDNGRAVLQLRNSMNKAQQWKMAKLADAHNEKYLPIKSKSGTVELRLPLKVSGIISKSRLQQWADDLEKAYFTFCELTSYRPYKNVIVDACKSYKYAGWVVINCNVIHVDRDFICTDLEKMKIRRCDWNFCVLHEMGHMFDFGKPWNFEAELLTDLKVAYVLEKHNAAAAPAEFSAFTVFHGADIIRAYKKLGSDFSVNYNIFGCTERFLRIKQKIGWESFRKTFHYLQQHSEDYRGYTDQQKFINFIKLLSHYGNCDVRSNFSSGEWNAILEKCNRK